MSKKNKNRMGTGTSSEPLLDNPFAQFADRLPKDLPKQGHVPQEERAKAEIIRTGKRAYAVERTRKGGYNLAFENRAKGKGVTVLRGVTGDAEALLRELKKRCGAGGTVHDDAVEVQGDQRKAIEFYLREQGM